MKARLREEGAADPGGSAKNLRQHLSRQNHHRFGRHILVRADVAGRHRAILSTTSMPFTTLPNTA